MPEIRFIIQTRDGVILFFKNEKFELPGKHSSGNINKDFLKRSLKSLTGLTLEFYNELKEMSSEGFVFYLCKASGEFNSKNKIAIIHENNFEFYRSKSSEDTELLIEDYFKKKVLAGLLKEFGEDNIFSNIIFKEEDMM